MKISLKDTRTVFPRQLGFGKYFADHMLIMRYKDGAWEQPEITPYAPFTLDPSAAVFHYGQAIFEGLKAYRSGDKCYLFRPKDNLKRLNTSADRLCIPKIDEQVLFDALLELLKIERDTIPSESGTSMYIRPTVIATENSLSVHASREYILFVILSPVGAYYANGLAPVKLLVEENYVRASLGGTGHYKVAGNYAGSLKAGEQAEKGGFDQVLWLDAKERRFVEEVGSMNIFFAYGDKIVTPALLGSILPGITRDSAIALLRHRGYEVEECQIELSDILSGINAGSVTEVFGTGTAAVISPVDTIAYRGQQYYIGKRGEMGKISAWLYDNLTKIQTGEIADPFDWVISF